MAEQEVLRFVANTSELNTLITRLIQRSRSDRDPDLYKWLTEELSNLQDSLVAFKTAVKHVQHSDNTMLRKMGLLLEADGPLDSLRNVLDFLCKELDGLSDASEPRSLELVAAVEILKRVFRNSIHDRVDKLSLTISYTNKRLIVLLDNTTSTECKFCMDLQQNVTFTVSVRALIFSSRRGCDGCKVLSTISCPYEQYSDIMTIETGSVDRVTTITFPYSIERGKLALTVHKSRGAFCPWKSFASKHVISGDTGSERAVSKVRKWMKGCAKHEHCEPLIPRALPTRIIEIIGHNRIVLRMTGDFDPHPAHYVCLSHRWGKGEVMRTTSESLQAYSEGIPWDNLPKTFQDAISFAERLGYIYVWIDSLCIVQDSISDWRHEGSKMDSIYSNASLTLMASAGGDPTAGCFHRNPNHTSWTFNDQGAGKDYELHVRPFLLHTRFEHSASHLPLLDRGWVFQERILSPRVVHFTEQELWWECASRITCECGEAPQSNISTVPTTRMSLRDIERRHPSLAWGEIVREYSEKSLTFEKDVFPALQGLAKRFQRPERPAYLAGLWEDSLLEDLLWTAVVAGERAQEWRAPSWSWASIVGAVVMPEPLAHASRRAIRLGEVTYAETIARGYDGFGELQCGLLELRCLGVSGRLSPRAYSASSSVIDYGLDVPNANLDAPIQFFSSKASFQAFLADFRWEPSEDHRSRGINVLILKMLKIVNETECDTYYLVLRDIEEDLDLYERIGVIITWASTDTAPGLGTGVFEEMFKDFAKERVAAIL